LRCIFLSPQKIWQLWTLKRYKVLMETPYTIVTPYHLGMSGLGLEYKYSLPTIRSVSWSQLWRDIKIREVETSHGAGHVGIIHSNQIRSVNERSPSITLEKAKRDGAPSRLVTSVESQWSPSWGPLL
jgi:hypothetical protein